MTSVACGRIAIDCCLPRAVTERNAKNVLPIALALICPSLARPVRVPAEL